MGDEAYNAAMATYSQWGLFFKAVANKFGLEKAYELHEDAIHRLGGGVEAGIKEQFPDGVNLKQLVEGDSAQLDAMGFTNEIIIKDENTIVNRITRCPRYDGFKMAGLSDEEIKEHCFRQVKLFEYYRQKADPRIRFDVPVWDAPNGRCDEEYKLTK